MDTCEKGNRETPSVIAHPFEQTTCPCACGNRSRLVPGDRCGKAAPRTTAAARIPLTRPWPISSAMRTRSCNRTDSGKPKRRRDGYRWRIPQGALALLLGHHTEKVAGFFRQHKDSGKCTRSPWRCSGWLDRAQHRVHPSGSANKARWRSVGCGEKKGVPISRYPLAVLLVGLAGIEPTTAWRPCQQYI